MTSDISLQVTALVASRNEAELLRRCLPRIAFCDEVIVIDIESGDDTELVAQANGARVVRHDYVPIAEWARVTVAPQARHDWLLVVDPDEEVPAALAKTVAELLPTLDPDVAAVDAPRQYFFRGRPLRGTVWGGPNRRRLLVRRSAVDLTPTIWGGMQLKEGFRVLELPFTAETAIAHHWANGYRALLDRHRRYLRLEPVDRADAREITGWKAFVTMPTRAFRESFVAKRGYRDGLTGLLLSLCWASFRTRSELGLLRELRSRRRSMTRTGAAEVADPPLVSIVTPSLNQGKFIEATIRSVIEQDYPHIEHIVVDGGSTDGTVEILQRYPHLRWVSEPDRGQADAVNKGFAMAKGEVFGWLNADDLYLPEAVSTAVEALRETGAALVHGGWRQIDEFGETIRDVEPKPFDLRLQLEERNAVAQPGAFFTRVAFEAVGGLDVRYRYAMDYELWLKLGKRFDIRHVDRIMGAYRYHAASKTVAETAGFAPETIRASRRHGGRFFSPLYVDWYLPRHRPRLYWFVLAVRLVRAREFPELKRRLRRRLHLRRS